MNFSTLEGIFRIIQSIPSKKAEPIKRWLATVGAERINQMQDPEKSIEQAVADYRRLGYSACRHGTYMLVNIVIREGGNGMFSFR